MPYSAICHNTTQHNTTQHSTIHYNALSNMLSWEFRLAWGEDCSKDTCKGWLEDIWETEASGDGLLIFKGKRFVIIYYCRNVFLLISGKIARVLNIKTRNTWEGTLCTFHDGPTWEETLCAPYIMELPGGGHFVHFTWRTYLEETLCLPYMTDLPERDTSCTKHNGPT